MTPEQEREFRALLAEVDEENSGWRSVMDPVAAELRSLRAALAASQTREAALREALTLASDYIQPRVRYVDGRGFEAHDPPIAALLDDPSPASDALGRVARASVALRRFEEEYPLKNGSEWDCRAALNILLSEAMGDWRAAIHTLLAVAPHWREPKDGGG